MINNHSQGAKERFGDALIQGAYITEKDLSRARKKADKNGVPLETYLVQQQLVTKDIIGQALAESYGVNYADLNTHVPSQEQIEKIPKDIAQKFRVILFSESKDSVLMTTDIPDQEGLGEALQPVFPNKRGDLAYSLSEDIDEMLRRYRTSLDNRLAAIAKEGQQVAPRLVDEIIKDALTLKASDIHLEPRLDDVLIRFRIDGVLQQLATLSKEIYGNIINRIKVLAQLRTDIHHTAQDGSIHYRQIKEDESEKTEYIDLRVSIVPLVSGEKVAIRLLANYVEHFTLSDIGLSETHEKLLHEIARVPFGMILVTGPTGSGKTTTLYSFIKAVQTSDVNITTIEDPVEYRIKGVNHIQVNTYADLTFAKGIRSIVRQDPNIIMVGEIRDRETADISVNAALTGHLLLSTFHANDAATAIPRLLDMKIEPFLLGSTLEAVIAQRLVRKICESCRISVKTSEELVNEQFKKASKYLTESTHVYKGKGCGACHETGYKGRTSIFEIIRISPALETLILQNPSSQEVWSLARKEGAISMFEDGILKVQKGLTTLHELMRVVQPPVDIQDNTSK